LAPRRGGFPLRGGQGGFVLWEAMLALILFGVVSVALIKTLARTSQLAVESQMDVRMLVRLQSKLTEFSKMSNLAEWDGQVETTDPDELGVWTVTSVSRIEDLKTEEGQELQQMYKVVVQAYYHVGWKSEPEMIDAVTWRYLPLYRTTTGGGAPAPATPAPPTPSR
jgi:hypothetical protein